MNLYPNTRGNAIRHVDKNVRLQTYMFCLELTKNFVKPSFGIEHGMGHYSTKWFHDLNLECFVSFEDAVQWNKCLNCCGKHQIFSFESVDDFTEKCLQNCKDVKLTIGLIDGPGDQKVDVLIAMIKIGIKGIIFHDAETLTKQEIEKIREAINQQNYFMWQYVLENPETLICYDENVMLGEGFVDFKHPISS